MRAGVAKFRSRIPLTLLRPALPAKRGLRLGRGRVGEGAEGGHQPSGNVDLTRPRRQTGAPGNEVRPIGIALVGETTASHAMISGKGLQRLNDRSCRRRACIVVLVIGPGSLSPATATAATSIGRRALVAYALIVEPAGDRRDRRAAGLENGGGGMASYAMNNKTNDDDWASDAGSGQRSTDA